MQSQFIILTILCPMFGAMASGLTSLKTPRYTLSIVYLFLGAAFFSALFAYINIEHGDTSTYFLSNWAPPIGIEFRADRFNMLIVIFILLVAILNLVHSNPMLASLFPRGRQFYALYQLLVASFIGLSLSGDLFNIYVFLEVSSLTSYALIGRGDGRACRAAFNYLLVGTVGASFYLIGVGFIYIKTGILNIHELSLIMNQPELFESKTIKAAFVFIILGLMTKMAVFPLHIWLPNSYSYCPQASVGLLAPLSTKVALFIMFKIVLILFSFEYVQSIDQLQAILVNLAAVGIFVVSFMALSQKNWVRTFTYFIVIEICYIFGGFWLQNEAGLIGASYHIFTDMLLTLGIFLFIGTIRAHYQAFTAANLSNLFKEFPLVSICFVVIGLTLIGIPPTGGFVSKLYLLKGAAEADQWLFFVSLLLASVTAAVIFFRVIEAGLFQKDVPVTAARFKNSSASMTVIMIIVAASLILIGILQENLVNGLRPYLGL